MASVADKALNRNPGHLANAHLDNGHLANKCMGGHLANR